MARDSSGIEIVQNNEASIPLRLTVMGRIGQVEGDDRYLFTRITSVARDPAGIIYVADGGSGFISRYSGDGSYLGRFGGRGNGPGELRMLDGLTVTRDRVFAFDRQSPAATSEYHLDGTYVRRWNSETAAGAAFIVGVDSVGPIALVSRDVRERAVLGQISQPWIEFYRLADTGSVIGEPIARVPAPRLAGARRPGNVVGRDWPLFEPIPAWAVAPDRLYVAQGFTYEVVAYGSDGAMRTIVRRAFTPRRIQDRDVDRWIRVEGERWNAEEFPPGSETQQDLIERARSRAELPMREYFGPTGALLAIRNGGFWVQRPDLLEDPTLFDLVTSEFGSRVRAAMPWERFDERGRYVGTASFPADFKPVDATESDVLGIAWDADDVQTVVVYRVSLESPGR